jgi:hypothetical protein
VITLNQDSGIFRKKSLEHVASPEQLTDYIRVSNPGVWLLLSIIVVLLVAAIAWAVFGSLPTMAIVNASVKNGQVVSYVDSGTAAQLKPGMAVQIGGVSGLISGIASQPLSAAELRAICASDYEESMLKAGDWNYAIEVTIAGVPDGLHPMSIILNRIRPISFLVN